jgi:hypothetical protein
VGNPIKITLYHTLKRTVKNVSTKTIAKWRNRDFVKDKTSRPKTTHYALNEMEREIIRVVRTLTWLELDDLTDRVARSMATNRYCLLPANFGK